MHAAQHSQTSIANFSTYSAWKINLFSPVSWHEIASLWIMCSHKWHPFQMFFVLHSSGRHSSTYLTFVHCFIIISILIPISVFGKNSSPTFFYDKSIFQFLLCIFCFHIKKIRAILFEFLPSLSICHYYFFVEQIAQKKKKTKRNKKKDFVYTKKIMNQKRSSQFSQIIALILLPLIYHQRRRVKLSSWWRNIKGTTCQNQAPLFLIIRGVKKDFLVRFYRSKIIDVWDDIFGVFCRN